MSEATCSLCKSALPTDAERAMKTCAKCANKIGIVPMPPSRRPPAPCTRCNGQKFLRAIPREHTSARAGDTNTQVSVPMYVTCVPRYHKSWLVSQAMELEVENDSYGLLEMYICKKCGAIEWYCVDVESIPVHPNMMTEEINYATVTPYRE